MTDQLPITITTPPGTSPEHVKTCCAASYSSDAVALLLGQSYHPGGLTLTRRLAGKLRLRPGDRVADIASGVGTTARLLAIEHEATVDGVDLSTANVDQARTATEKAGLTYAVQFHRGDAEHLPLPDSAFEAVVCECAFCTFPDKRAAAAEFARILRPGGRVGFTDVTVTGTLPPELTGLTAWVACIADARRRAEYTAILHQAGLVVTHTEDHDDAVARMIDEIEARIRLLRVTAAQRLAVADIDADAVLRYTRLTRQAVNDGLIGYALLVAEKGCPR